MRASIITSILAFAASQVAAQYNNQSAPFALVLCSANSTLNGSTLGACHEGAAEEGLCVGGPLNNSPVTFTFNTSTPTGFTPDPVLGTPGSLDYELHGANFNLSSPMQISTDVISNTAVPLFTPGYGFTSVGFDNENRLFVWGTRDDTVSPPEYATKAYYRWYVCLTNAGYTYETLAWVIGPGEPENPSCQKVHVQRVFI